MNKGISVLILFTTNQRKIAEARTIIDENGIEFEARSADIDEIQHHDPTEIAKAKAKAAYEIIKRPLVINDSSWSIPALNGFPGGYMKEVNKWFSAQDWLNLLRDKKDRSAILHERTIYYDGELMRVFEVSTNGIFVDSPRGEWPEDMEKLVSLYEGKTLAENHEDEKAGDSMKHSEHWREFAEWYHDALTAK